MKLRLNEVVHMQKCCKEKKKIVMIARIGNGQVVEEG